MRKKWLMGNWKMNGDAAKLAEFSEYFSAYTGAGAEFSFAVPFVYLALGNFLKGDLIWGAQDLSEHPSGAYTGEISAAMLKELGVKYVIVGHSERRQYHQETNELVARKAQMAKASGLTPVICVGETLADREAGKTESIIQAQLAAVLELEKGEIFQNAILAYEPVWAIGTGLSASPDQIETVHRFLRNQLKACHAGIAEKTRIVYGGSLKSANADSVFALENVDGGLVGGASLIKEEFLAILKAVGK